jgi:hypothetical protein
VQAFHEIQSRGGRFERALDEAGGGCQNLMGKLATPLGELKVLVDELDDSRWLITARIEQLIFFIFFIVARATVELVFFDCGNSLK